jgi:NAD(P)H dehydrogenase (quinone)
MNKRKFLKQAGAASLVAGFVVASKTSQAQAPADVNILIVYHSVTGNTEKMAQGVAEGAKGVSGTTVILKKVGDVSGDELLACDGLIVGSPVYYANMAGEVKTFFDNWLLKFRFAFADFKMRNKVGGAFVTGASISNGKESKSGLLIGVKLTHILGTAVVEHLGHQGPNLL